MNNEAILIRLTEEVKLRGFSKKTLKVYLYHTNKFIAWYNKPLKYTHKEDIRKYFLHLNSQNLDENTIRLIGASLKFTFTKIY